MRDERINELAAAARELGAETARSMATWVELDRPTAISIHTDVDPAVLDAIRFPSLSGEFADDPTPETLYAELGLSDSEREDLEDMLTDPFCAAWEDAASETFGQELQRIAAAAMTPEDHVSVLVARAQDAEQEVRTWLARGNASKASDARRRADASWTDVQTYRHGVYEQRRESGDWPGLRPNGTCEQSHGHHVGDMCLSCGNDER